MRHLLWFRNDLRCHDQPALQAACQSGAQVVALYITDRAAQKSHDTALTRWNFDVRSIRVLADQLKLHGIPLLVRTVADLQAMESLFAEIHHTFNFNHVFVSREYGPNEQKRDRQIQQWCTQRQIDWHEYDSGCILAPGLVLKNDNNPYQVFTPFRTRWLSLLTQHFVPEQDALTGFYQQPPIPFDSLQVDLPSVPESLIALWPAGESEALQRLDRFITQELTYYHQQRDLPALPGTSRLSPYFANGSLSARIAVQRALNVPGQGAQTWVSELAWRDFFQHILYHYQKVGKHRAFQHHTEALQWSDDQERFERWCNGRTGFPLIDAAMRQLSKTGWMHNRLRMITAMFLVKDLWINWQWGERWFMQQLIDGELAANNGNWQWCASTGVDAAPYFRIFNPWTQSQRFDPEGTFIRYWVPELAQIPKAALHKPPSKGSLDPRYPAPMIDHDKARLHALAAFRALDQRLVER